MKGKVNIILLMFLSSLKEFDLGLSVTKDGHFIFNDRKTGEQLYVLRENIIKAYDEA